MKVADVMSRGVELVSPEATVQEAATRMAEDDVGAVLVGSGDALQGILTDRDVILRAVVDGLDTTSVRVRELMSSSLFTCREEDTIEAAFQAMSEHQVRRLPVFDNDGKLSGVVTLSDLGRLERDAQRAAEALREMAEPHRRRSIEPTAPEAASASGETAATDGAAAADGASASERTAATGGTAATHEAGEPAASAEPGASFDADALAASHAVAAPAAVARQDAAATPGTAAAPAPTPDAPQAPADRRTPQEAP